MHKKYKQLSLYIPEEVYVRLKDVAEEEHRSVNKMILHIVDNALPYADLPATIRAMKQCVEQG